MRKLVIGLMTTVALLTSPAHSKNIVVANNPGGYMTIFAIRALRAERAGDTIVFRGFCLSACTMLLYVPNKCLSGKVVFGFHRPYDPKTLKNDDESTNFYLDYMPEWVKKWLAYKGGLKKDMVFMPASYAAKFVRACSRDDLRGGVKLGRKVFRPKD